MISSNESLQYLTNSFIYTGAAVLTLTGIFIFYYLYKESDLIRSINTLALGFLLTIFIVGWSLPQLNNQLGWGNMCAKAIELADEYEINDYWVYNIKRSENMDVYLKKDVIIVDKEVLKNSTDKKLLMLRAKDIENDPEISSLVLNKIQYPYGDNIIVILN